MKKTLRFPSIEVEDRKKPKKFVKRKKMLSNVKEYEAQQEMKLAKEGRLQ